MMTLLLAFTLAAPGPKEAGKELPKLDGEYSLVSYEGSEAKKDELVTVRIEGDLFMVKEAKRDKSEDAKFTVDFKAKPATIDIRPARPGGKEEMGIPGIIEVMGDTVRICFVKGGGSDRPTEFKADAAKGTVLLTLKRIKAEK